MRSTICEGTKTGLRTVGKIQIQSLWLARTCPKGVQEIRPHLARGAGSVITALGGVPVQSVSSGRAPLIDPEVPPTAASRVMSTAHVFFLIDAPFSLASAAARNRRAPSGADG